MFYIRPTEAESNYELALKWLKKAERGESYAKVCLGIMYEHGVGVKQDYTVALSHYREAARKRNPVGQFRIGLMYEMGKGVQKDDWEAANWYQKAANSGLTEAQMSLGKMYEKSGEPKKAMEWYQKAGEYCNE